MQETKISNATETKKRAEFKLKIIHISHDYFGIDADEIWSIIQNHLIPLRTDINALLEVL